ncbi:MAG: O-methyltransferase [Bacteroidia bacterium]|nr:O-methyltransferase [Bacteroidia bacterium]
MFESYQKIKDYIFSHSEPEDDILKELYRETNVRFYHPQRISGYHIGKLLQIFCRMLKPKNILEIGTFTGYASICIAQAINNRAKLHTIEINDELEDFIRTYFERASVAHKIILHIGDARKIIRTLDILFDLVFIDGEKNEYSDYYKISFDKVKHGGFIIADNVLWNGKVVKDEIESNDYFTKGILEFNSLVHNDSRVENVILPVCDGVMVIRKK